MQHTAMRLKLCMVSSPVLHDAHYTSAEIKAIIDEVLFQRRKLAGIHQSINGVRYEILHSRHCKA